MASARRAAAGGVSGNLIYINVMYAQPMRIGAGRQLLPEAHGLTSKDAALGDPR